MIVWSYSCDVSKLFLREVLVEHEFTINPAKSILRQRTRIQIKTPELQQSIGAFTNDHGLIFSENRRRESLGTRRGRDVSARWHSNGWRRAVVVDSTVPRNVRAVATRFEFLASDGRQPPSARGCRMLYLYINTYILYECMYTRVNEGPRVLEALDPRLHGRMREERKK